MHIADISQSFSWTHFCMCKLLIRIKIICNTGNIIPDSFSFFFFSSSSQHRNTFAWNKLRRLIRSLTHTSFLETKYNLQNVHRRKSISTLLFIYTLTSDYPYLHTSKRCEEGECRYITRSLQCCTRYNASQDRRTDEHSKCFIVRGTESWHFKCITCLSAALFSFIYNPVQIMLKMQTC